MELSLQLNIFHNLFKLKFNSNVSLWRKDWSPLCRLYSLLWKSAAALGFQVFSRIRIPLWIQPCLEAPHALTRERYLILGFPLPELFIHQSSTFRYSTIEKENTLNQTCNYRDPLSRKNFMMYRIGEMWPNNRVMKNSVGVWLQLCYKADCKKANINFCLLIIQLWTWVEMLPNYFLLIREYLGL